MWPGSLLRHRQIAKNQWSCTETPQPSPGGSTERADTAPSITAAAATSPSAAGQPGRGVPGQNLRQLSLGQQPTSVKPQRENE